MVVFSHETASGCSISRRCRPLHGAILARHRPSSQQERARWSCVPTGNISSASYHRAEICKKSEKRRTPGSPTASRTWIGAAPTWPRIRRGCAGQARADGRPPSAGPRDGNLGHLPRAYLERTNTLLNRTARSGCGDMVASSDGPHRDGWTSVPAQLRVIARWCARSTPRRTCEPGRDPGRPAGFSSRAGCHRGGAGPIRCSVKPSH